MRETMEVAGRNGENGLDHYGTVTTATTNIPLNLNHTAKATITDGNNYRNRYVTALRNGTWNVCFFRAYSKRVRCEEGGGGLEVEVELFIAIREVVENVRGDPNHGDPNTEHGYVAAKLLQSHFFVRFPSEHSRKHPCLVFLSVIFSLQRREEKRRESF
ncbi:hypothetical protein TEA_000788 [Camellia sinensis var. sinensis]|uniref:Uncharacterized protein n=1 Tax=Camellia sinensis var. sinensis TaxID=542762 RepID=A0A4S4EB52_CAMSN|nr:hypothetical protein TEA_000788 [Camellia sinensis var. sinensis]